MSKGDGALVAACVLMACGLVDVGYSATTVMRSGVPFTIDVWDTDEGLPQHSVIAMTQSQDGYLWLGTINGLARFDGFRFTVFEPQDVPELRNGPVVYLFEDSQRHLWIGTQDAGVLLVKDGVVKGVDIGKSSREGVLISACEDTKGAVWLCTERGQVFRHRNGRVDVWDFNRVASGGCRIVAPGPDGSVYLGTAQAIYVVGDSSGLSPQDLPVKEVLPVGLLDFLLASPKGGYWRLANGQVQKWVDKQLDRDLGSYPWGKSGHVSCAIEDGGGNLLVGTRGSGLFRFEPSGKVTALSTNEGLSHNYVLSVHVDKEGTLWVGTDGGGLNRVKHQLFEPLQASRGLAVQSVCTDTTGALWIGSNGAGVYSYKDGLFELRGLTNLSIRCVLGDQEGGIWAGTWGLGLLQLRRGDFMAPSGLRTTPPIVQAALQDRQGQIYFGTRGGLLRKDRSGWTQFTTRDGLTSDSVLALATDEDGTLWIGTRGGGLNRLQDGKFSAFRQADGGLPGDEISALHFDADGVLWVTTPGNGLGRYHHNRWTRYGTREGLLSNNLGYILEDQQDHLWIGSYSGLMRLPKKALNDFARGATNFIPCRVYGRRDGLPSGECTFGSQPAAARSADGRLWFPTIDGVASIDPAKLTQNLYPPPVVIESVLVDGRPRNTNALRSGGLDSLTLPAGEQRLEIRYTSLNLAAPERARFRYRLEEHESDWTDAGSARVVRYSRLPPGKYRFQVTACNEDGVWNEEGSSLAILIQPPFWQTAWFLTASAAGLLGATIGLVHFFSTQKLQREVQKLKQQEALERERSRIARDLHDQLGANLTQVALLGEMAQSDKEIPEEVEAHAQQISSTARETTRALDEIVWAVNPSNDTLDGLMTYACKYAQDYFRVAGLRYRVDGPAQLPAASIPPDVRHNIFLAFKESVTNVVKHARATEGRIRFRLNGDCFALEVEDNGQGLPKEEQVAAKMRNGLRNMRKRMEDIGGSFFIGQAPEGGTLVRLTAPLAKPSRP